MKKTKIVCTIGPASDSEEVLKDLFLNGLNVCRLNFSHGKHEDYKRTIERIKKIRNDLDMPIAIMLDTKGPEIRLGDFENGEVTLKEGDSFTLTSQGRLGNQSRVSISCEQLSHSVNTGDIILIDDGLVELKVLEIIDSTDVKCVVLNGGTIKNHKGVNVPNVEIGLPSMTQKDIDDIIFGIENGVDFIAPSFIRKAEDVIEIRRILENNGGEHINIVSKIENQQGIDNIDEIINVSDGIMVARGDMGVEIETEMMPIVQKQLIKKCNLAGKPVITATQMLDSMMRNPRPTRAEVTDVANAILDGTSAIMLSGETASGKYPIESVKTMSNIAKRTEESLDYIQLLKERSTRTEINITNAIGKATCYTAQDLEAAAIITLTHSGYTSRTISKFRPRAPILAATTREEVMRQLALAWGVYPILIDDSENIDDSIGNSISKALEDDYVKQGDLVVVTAGVPLGLPGTTNLIKVHTIGKVLANGTGIGKLSSTGRVCIGNNLDDLLMKFEEGDILISKKTDRDIITFMERCSGIITEDAGLSSHGAIVGLNLEKATIVGIKNATEIFKDGDMITMDSKTGQVYEGKLGIIKY